MSFLNLIKAEFKAISSNFTILLTIIGGIIFYSFLYPQPYLEESLKQQKIILIDLDNTSMSRKLTRMISSSSIVHIVKSAKSIKEAENSLKTGEAVGYFLIPKDFQKDIVKQASPVLAFGADASYFLVYGAVAEVLSEIVESFSNDIRKQRIIMGLYRGNQIINLSSQAIFNPTSGYTFYIIVGVFVLILHQIMIAGVGLLCATQKELSKKGIKGYWQQVSALKLLSARMLVFLIIYLAINMYYLGFCYQIYGMILLANVKEILFLIVIFILSANALGLVLGQIVPRSELVTFYVLLSSLPLVFSAGFIWPNEHISPILKWIVNFIPSTSAIPAFIKLNQMGANLNQILPNLIELASLTLMYFCLAWYLLRKSLLRQE